MPRDLVPYSPPVRQQEGGDFAVTIKVRNGRFLSALKRAGYHSVNHFCKQHGLSQGYINCYATMTRSPYHRSGKPTETAQQVADILGIAIEDMFPPRFLSRCLDKVAKIDKEMTEDQLAFLLQNSPRNPEQLLLMDEAAKAVSDTLRLIPPRNERAIRLTHAMGTRSEKTLKEAGEQLNVTPERFRQIEAKGIRLLQHPSRSSRLVEAAEILGIGHFRRSTGPFKEVTKHSVGIIPASREMQKPPKPVKEPEAKPVKRKVRFPAPLPPYVPLWQQVAEINRREAARRAAIQAERERVEAINRQIRERMAAHEHNALSRAAMIQAEIARLWKEGPGTGIDLRGRLGVDDATSHLVYFRHALGFFFPDGTQRLFPAGHYIVPASTVANVPAHVIDVLDTRTEEPAAA